MNRGDIIKKGNNVEDEEAAAEKEGMIKINISYESKHHQLLLSPLSTFGYVKEVVEQTTGLDRRRLKVLFRGQEMDDADVLHHAGVRHKSKILVLVAQATTTHSNTIKNDDDDDDDVIILDEEEDNEEHEPKSSVALSAISQFRNEVDKLGDRVAQLEMAVNVENRVADEKFIVSTELLMRQLLILDFIHAPSDNARLIRKAQVKRVQDYHDILDNLKAINSTTTTTPLPPSAVSIATAVTTTI